MNAAKLFNTLRKHETYHEDSRKHLEAVELRTLKIEKQVTEIGEGVHVTKLVCDLESRLLTVEEELRKLKIAQEAQNVCMK